LNKPKFNGKEVYAVIFKNSKTALLGDIVVFVGLDKKTIVGKGYRDLKKHC
jgi:hypothetical protein